jgi:hypothetical protein
MGGSVVKNAYTFAKRSKELAKKKKKEEKLQRKSQRGDLPEDGQPIYDEATGQIIVRSDEAPEPSRDESEPPVS